MLCYVMLCYVTLRYVTLRYVTLRYVTLRYVMLCYIVLYYVMLIFYVMLYLTDIPRLREEYEVIYGTRRNVECHFTSILRAGVEYLFYFMTNSHYLFVT